jgi:hypothetical protein
MTVGVISERLKVKDEGSTKHRDEVNRRKVCECDGLGVLSIF